MTSGWIPSFNTNTWRTLIVHVQHPRPLDKPTTAPTTRNQGNTAGHRARWRPRAVVVIAVSGVLFAVLADPVIAGAALATGILNTASGGGAVVTFVALTAAGVPALTAHATSQVLTPASFLGGLHTNTSTMRGYRPDPRWMAAGMAGAVCGVIILAVTPPATFQTVAPWCLLPAAALVVTQEPIRRLVRNTGRRISPTTTIVAVFACGIYAGMIGVGTGTLAVAVLGLVPAFVRTPLTTLLRIRNVLLLSMAFVVAAAFAGTGLVDWKLVALLAAPAAVGGWLGTRLLGHIPHWTLKATIVATALAGTAWMLWPA